MKTIKIGRNSLRQVTNRVLMCLGASLAALSLASCGNSPPEFEYPVSWVESFRGGGTIELESDGTGFVASLPISTPGPDCVPSGENRFTGNITWSFHSADAIEMQVSGETVYLRASYRFAEPNWDRLHLMLCGLDRQEDYVGFEGLIHWTT